MGFDIEPLQTANIKGLLEAFDAALAKVCQDYAERPGVFTKRSVTVEVTITPDKSEHAILNPDIAEPEIVTEVKVKLPGTKCVRMSGRLDTRLGTVMVNPPAVDEGTNQTNFDNVTQLNRGNAEG